MNADGVRHPGRGNPPRAAVFDVDGTLVDSNHLHTVAWWEAFRQYGHQVPMSAIHHCVGLPSGRLTARLVGPKCADEQGDAISTAHSVVYAQWHERLQALDGAAALLRTLAGRGWRIYLATSAKGGELTALRRAINADDAILGATTAEDVSEGKPAPEPIEAALDAAGVRPEHARFVGDSIWDVEAAERAGVECVALLSGGNSQAELVEAGAVAVYENPARLLAALDSSPLRD
ncbi:HAD family hydrolase [Streptomyces sp. NA04227]|uniref:HAD family hydrolase n=1 Tax=Streptomyces sp. NA04227 TaxID=2742136 RepID=UPI0015985207|nr:HAD family hydrolase [Streptomyces sp. NA04227]QKW09809.1 HAD family hydrolase [Streptomyces sp. NA04227]